MPHREHSISKYPSPLISCALAINLCIRVTRKTALNTPLNHFRYMFVLKTPAVSRTWSMICWGTWLDAFFLSIWVTFKGHWDSSEHPWWARWALCFVRFNITLTYQTYWAGIIKPFRVHCLLLWFQASFHLHCSALTVNQWVYASNLFDQTSSYPVVACYLWPEA